MVLLANLAFHFHSGIFITTTFLNLNAAIPHAKYDKKPTEC